MGVTVTGLTAEKMLEFANAQIIDAEVTAGVLHFTTRGGSDINAGAVGGDPGDVGPAGPTSIVVVADEASRPTGGDLFEGLAIWQEDVKLVYFWDNSNWILVPAGIPHSETVNVDTITTGMTNPAFTPFENPVTITDFVKLRDDTKIIVAYQGGIRNNNAFGEYVVGVHVSVVDDDYDILYGFGDNGPKAGSVQIDGLDADTYIFNLKRRRGNGAGTVYDGQHDDIRNTMTVTETF